MPDQRTSTELERLIEGGSQLAGGLTGAAAGTAVAGPVGGVLGAGIGVFVQRALHRVGNELARRHLAPQAEARVGAVWILARNTISARIMAGETHRSDDFFMDADDRRGRSPAEELLEGVFVVAEETYEERKLPYLAHLYAAFVFDAGISKDRAHQLLTMAKRLTYRELVILASFARLSYDERLQLLEPDALGQEPDEALSVRTDMLSLIQQGLAWMDSGRASPFTPQQVKSTGYEPSRAGNWLISAMRLDLIPAGECESLVVHHFRGTQPLSRLRSR